MIQIRHVPAQLHRTLKSRAALAGMSLSDYLLAELKAIAERPTLQEMQARLRSRSPAIVSIGPAEALRLERDAR